MDIVTNGLPIPSLVSNQTVGNSSASMVRLKTFQAFPDATRLAIIDDSSEDEDRAEVIGLSE